MVFAGHFLVLSCSLLGPAAWVVLVTGHREVMYVSSHPDDQEAGLGFPIRSGYLETCAPGLRSLQGPGISRSGRRRSPGARSCLGTTGRGPGGREAQRRVTSWLGPVAQSWALVFLSGKSASRISLTERCEDWIKIWELA